MGDKNNSDQSNLKKTGQINIKLPELTEENNGEMVEPKDPNLSDDEFQVYLDKLKMCLPGMEDKSFKWKNVDAFLIMKLSSTDCLRNSTRISHYDKKGKASNIPITSGKDESKINFFPLLEVNNAFSHRRLRVYARMNNRNIKALDDSYDKESGWIQSTIQIRNRGSLNDGKSPIIHICFDGDLTEVRKRLGKDDYLIIVKQKNINKYEAFGILKETADLGTHKKIYVRNDIVYRSSKESTVYDIEENVINSYVRIFDLSIDKNSITFEKSQDDPNYYIGDEVWVVNSETHLISDRLIITNVNGNNITAIVKEKIDKKLSKRILENLNNLPDILKEFFYNINQKENGGE